jgi:tight adherence protein B
MRAGVVAVMLQWPAGRPSGMALAGVIAATGLSVVLARRARSIDATDRARALGARAARLPGGRLRRLARARLEAALVAADVAPDAGGAVQVWLLAALAAGCLAGGLDLVLTPAAMLSVLVGGPIALFGARHRGARRGAVELPVALELVASELRTGGTVIGALGALARTGVAPARGALTADFARITRRCELGAPLQGALAAWAGERNDPGFRSAAGALAVAATTGGRSAEALDGLASSLRDRIEIAAEARALSAQARLSAIVVGSLPLAYLAGCAVVDPRQVRVLTGTSFGIACLGSGLALEGLAVVWIRAILRREGSR